MYRVAGIYQIKNPLGEIYIGHTYSLNHRKATHKRLRPERSHLNLYISFQEHGFDSHEIKMLHELPQDVSKKTLLTYEQFFIDQHLEAGTALLNNQNKSQFGFDKGYTPWNKGKKGEYTSDRSNVVVSEETKKKQSDSLRLAWAEGRRKRTISEETRKRMSDARKLYHLNKQK